MTKEKLVRKAVEIIFIVRYWVIFIMLAALSFITYHVSCLPDTQIRDTVAVFTGGCVIISVFYAAINYEYTQRRFKHDVKTAKDIASFNIALEWQKEYMTKVQNTVRVFYVKNKQLLDDGTPRKFQDELDKPENDDAYTALVVMLNFLESVCLGVKQDMMDEEYVKGFFGTVFAMQYNRYISFIEYRRRDKQNPKIWKSFTTLSEKWISCE